VYISNYIKKIKRLITTYAMSGSDHEILSSGPNCGTLNDNRRQAKGLNGGTKRTPNNVNVYKHKKNGRPQYNCRLQTPKVLNGSAQDDRQIKVRPGRSIRWTRRCVELGR